LAAENRVKARLELWGIDDAGAQHSGAPSHCCSELGNVELRFPNLLVVPKAIKQELSLKGIRYLVKTMVG
jgi:hypothetical protein